MGTAEAEVKAERTRRMPLVDKEASEALVQDDRDRGYLEALPFPDEAPALDSGPPEGMRSLWPLN